jgi:hypothetical protein
VADAVEHTPYLAFSSLMDGDLKPRIRFFLADLFYFCRGGLSIIKIDPAFKLLQFTVFRHALDLCQIGLWKLMLRVRDQMGEVTVIRQEQKALGIIVKSSHGIHADLDAF